MKTINHFLNSITMYRLLVYSLGLLATLSLLLSFFGLLSFTPFQLLSSLMMIITTSFLANQLLATLYRATPNHESFLITALILFFLFSPATNLMGISSLVLASIFAMSSKYLFAYKAKHLFNPAAISAVLMGLLPFTAATWWVVNPYLAIPTLILGLLIVKKIRRLSLFLSFLTVNSIAITLTNWAFIDQPLAFFWEILTSWPILFFGTIMVTEPLTTPPTQKLQILYGGLVGFLAGIRFQVGPFFSTPELALVIGNIFSFLVSSKAKFVLSLHTKEELAPYTWQFSFNKPHDFHFQPGQYLEWTLPNVPLDSRGNRRYFTIASAPTHQSLDLSIKYNQPASSFKQQLMSLQSGHTITTGQLAGDFVLPSDPHQKLVFIAGGIGITPFHSMIQYLAETDQSRDITLFYAASNKEDLAYRQYFEKVKIKINLKPIYILGHETTIPKNWYGYLGRLNSSILKTELKNPTEYTYYLSGPEAMVEAYKKLLSQLKVPISQIKIDYFPGF